MVRGEMSYLVDPCCMLFVVVFLWFSCYLVIGCWSRCCFLLLLVVVAVIQVLNGELRGRGWVTLPVPHVGRKANSGCYKTPGERTERAGPGLKLLGMLMFFL